MWNIVRATVRGSAHERIGTPCQDAAGHKLLGETLIIAISDGAGSASHSDQGATTAVAAALSYIEKLLVDDIEFTSEAGLAIFDNARRAIFDLSERLTIDVRELACTLLFAVVQQGGAFFGQLGDGAWVMTYGPSLLPATWPLRGRYANETSFLTSGAWSSACQFAKFAGPIEAVAGFTDGVQSLALHYASHCVFQPFFEPILKALRHTSIAKPLDRELAVYLSSAAIADRTDDDRTLVVVTKRRRRLLGNGTS
jgi:hypothetical protein